MPITPKKNVEKMQAYHVDMYKKEYKYKLDENENQYGPSPKVIEVLQKMGDKSVKFYPSYGKLIEKLAEFNQLPFEYFLNTNGADEAINVIFTTYLDENSTVLTVKPSFSMPKIYAQICGAKYVEVPYTIKWQFPIEEFLKQIDDIENLSLIHLTTPNNPTGDCIPRETIEKIIERANGKIVVIDETYANYACKFNSDLALKYDNVFVVRSFSKDFALAGLRAGYIISNPYNIVQLNKVRSPYSTNSIAQQAAIAALDDVEYFRNVYKKLCATKDELVEFLKNFTNNVYNTESNFILADFGEKSEFVYNEMLKNSIIVRKFDNNEFMKNTFRIGIPTEEGFEAIKKVFNSIKKDTLIFDMDGVLVDTSASYRLAIKKTYEFFSGEQISYEKIQDAKNLGGLNNDWDLTEFLLKKSGVQIDKNELIVKCQSFYWNKGCGLICDEKLLIDKKLLEELAKTYNLAIFTGRPRMEAMFTLEYNGISNFFDTIITMNDLPNDRQKPDPLGINLIREKLYCNKIFYFGDTIDDITCGKSADVISVGVLPPQDQSEDLKHKMKEKNADFVLQSINELTQILEKQNA